MEFGVVVQAGGESRRMGQNKALLPFLGKTLIERVISRIKVVSDEILITSNEPALFEFMNLPVFADVVSGKGALGGLYTAFSMANSPLVAVVACDMPFVNPQLLIALRELLIADNYDAVVPRLSAGCEPFHAVYRREVCLEAVKASLDQGLKRADSWHPLVRMGYFNPEDIARYDPSGLAFFNINDPEEYRHALEIAEKEG